MNRREILTAAAAIGLVPAARAVAAAGDLRGAAREAYIYCLPLIEMAAARDRMLHESGEGQPAGLNFLKPTRKLTTDKNRTITTPNNDTLYSSAWLDLTKGPLTLTIPPSDRYVSVALLNMYSDNDAILGTRTTGNGGGRYTIVGPGQPGSGPNIVRCSTPHAWLLVRILSDGPADLAAAHALQDRFVLTGPKTPPPRAYATRKSSWKDYFTSAQALLIADPPPAVDGVVLARIAALGLKPGGGFDPAKLDAAAIREIEAGVAEALPSAARRSAPNIVAGWTYPRGDIGVWGQDYDFRAVVALGGLAALPPVEAMYLRPVGDGGPGTMLGGNYRLSFAAGKLPPVDSFWSITMYEATSDGQFFLTENALNRFSIGDRSPGLKKNPDGSLDIWIGRNDPGGEKTSNWLPAPAKGPFTISLRAYLAKAELLDGRWRAPPLTRL
ncbi:DUF1254 domain-containing protein [Phenylobacterium sp.]|jgi:hypothetical protein|uniref:DUF1254 domain-containing protein n=1 Tax=Phenylobacterium sp. TaxID=1871053 RepID=UPI002E30516C|nr:DUF1254 domain-containing protein [Phenylobacterium sp.]HEX3365525.1 DUF1254 domain-containing protein [Phenylobacterium sp.]